MMKLVVLSCVLAMASAGALISPLAYSTPYISSALNYASPITYASPGLSSYAIPGPISYAQAPAVHVLKKRSAPLIESAPLIQSAISYASPIAYSSPIVYSSPALAAQYTPLTYGQAPLVHLLKKREPEILPEAHSPI